MISRFLITLAVLFAGLHMISAAQNPPANGADDSRSTPAPALTGMLGINQDAASDDAGGDGPQIPSLLGGPGISVALTSETERSNYLRGGINVGAGYDDNAFLDPSGAQGSTSFSVFPSIAIDQTRSRMRWALGYAGGFTASQRLSDSNQGSHALNFESQFRLSPHVNLRVAENFSLTSGLFASGGTGNSVPTGNLITPLSTQRSSSTVAEVSYHFALKDVVGASGSFDDLHHTNVPAGSGTLVDSRTASGLVFWLHGLFRHDWAGLSYSFQRLTYDQGNGETKVHSITVVDTLSLPKGFSVSGFIGPEYSDNRGIAATGTDAGQFTQFSNWSVGSGAEAGWHSTLTSVRGGYSRRVSNGSGLLGVVHRQDVHAEMRRQLVPGWAASLRVSHGDNKSITSPQVDSATSIQLTNVGATLERNVGRSLALSMGYSHDFQSQSRPSGQTLSQDASRNRFIVTLGYQWARPLGR